MKEAKAVTYLLPTEVIQLLRPLQKAIKICSQQIKESPWASLATSQSSQTPNGSAYTTRSPVTQGLPMTPQSAALGPAVQATVPNSSASNENSYNAMFSKYLTLDFTHLLKHLACECLICFNCWPACSGRNFFERADSYLSNGGSLASSRAGTMTSNYTNDGTLTPASIVSPMNTGSRMNVNMNGKAAFWYQPCTNHSLLPVSYLLLLSLFCKMYESNRYERLLWGMLRLLAFSWSIWYFYI